MSEYLTYQRPDGVWESKWEDKCATGDTQEEAIERLMKRIENERVPTKVSSQRVN